MVPFLINQIFSRSMWTFWRSGVFRHDFEFSPLFKITTTFLTALLPRTKAHFLLFSRLFLNFHFFSIRYFLSTSHTHLQKSLPLHQKSGKTSTTPTPPKKYSIPLYKIYIYKSCKEGYRVIIWVGEWLFCLFYTTKEQDLKRGSASTELLKNAQFLRFKWCFVMVSSVGVGFRWLKR